jgi:hypothetical protein
MHVYRTYTVVLFELSTYVCASTYNPRTPRSITAPGTREHRSIGEPHMHPRAPLYVARRHLNNFVLRSHEVYAECGSSGISGKTSSCDKSRAEDSPSFTAVLGVRKSPHLNAQQHTRSTNQPPPASLLSAELSTQPPTGQSNEDESASPASLCYIPIVTDATVFKT